MPKQKANGVELYYELHGSGDPMVLVHGGWIDGRDWEPSVGPLAQSFRVLVYDRRGHSRSERPATQGTYDEDGDDLAALIETLDLAPAHVVTNSAGGNIALRLASRRPALFRSLCCHEPPLFGLLEGDPEGVEMLAQGTRSIEEVAGKVAAGDHERAARQFIEEIALGPGAWESLPAETRKVMVDNAPTFLDEVQDPEALGIDETELKRLDLPVHFTYGSESPPIFARVIERVEPLISRASHEVIEGASHEPQISMPERYVEVVTGAVRAAA